ncbi:hypothetical protein DPMN_037852 [Dreissena polymorpha]|uniref:Uncharacterized protein n=1 Tax=Dreissena polymorpha TaxID=45954 RepID=A0A9D4RN64_DREPO|nr:hypothetical protein DPMN_037852 [Dreissena polymorpha]
MKLHRYIDHDSQMTPIDFEVTRSKVTMTPIDFEVTRSKVKVTMTPIDFEVTRIVISVDFIEGTMFRMYS